MATLPESLNQLVLEIPLEVQQAAWQQGQAVSPIPTQWTVYLNQVCLNTFLPWLQTEYFAQATVCPEQAFPLPLWTIVNGTPISLGAKRLVLLPTQTIDTSELRVPQEWVDIPSWAGDYFLGVQVNAEEQWLRIWGYSTHEQLKRMGCYDPDDRTYVIQAQDMISDLSILWVVQQLYPDEPTQAAIASLPTLSQPQPQNLLQRLATLAIREPRLEVPFQLWGALIVQEDWLQTLYQYRHGGSAMAPTEVLQTAHQAVVNLGQWFQAVFESTWESLDSLFEAQPNLAFNFRRSSVADTTVRRGRAIQLPQQFGPESMALIISLKQDNDRRIKIHSQLFSLGPSRTLTPGVRMELVIDRGEVLQAVEAEEQDDCLQLPRFKLPPGQRFQVKVTLRNFVFSELFMT